MTGRFKTIEDFDEDDYRRTSPRFQGDNFQRNLNLVAHIERLAREKNCRPAQLALAWVLSRGEDIVPIAGTKHARYVEENAGALDVRLTEQDLRTIEEIAPKGVAAGPRYPEAMMKMVGL